MKTEMDTSLEQVTMLEDRYQLATYKKMPIVAERGEGVWIHTTEGETYLDLYGGHAVAGFVHATEVTLSSTLSRHLHPQ